MLTKSKVKYIQSLGHKKFRDEEGVFLVEGPKMVAELLQHSPSQVSELFAVQPWVSHEPIAAQFADMTTIVTDDELAKISQLVTPNRIIALVKKFDPMIDANPAKEVVLALDRIQDPGNLGTIIRIADWFGVKHIICNADCADLYNPKVIQSTMGSYARVQLLYTNLEEWLRLYPEASVYATVLEGQSVNDMKQLRDGVIVIGNESKGISDEVMQRVNVKITIPRIGEAESLNAAVATGIILSHLK